VTVVKAWQALLKHVGTVTEEALHDYEAQERKDGVSNRSSLIDVGMHV